MKKKMIFLFGIILVCFLMWKTYQYYRIKNVFDEIYYSEIDYVKHHKAVGLPMMKQIEPIDHKHIQKFDELTIIIESYKKEYLAKNEELIFSFSYSSKSMGFIYTRKLDTDTVLQIGYDYSVKNRICEEYIGIALSGIDETSPNTKEEIQQYLDKYHITHEELQKKAHEILYDKVLKDWIASYDTRFSLKNIGDVKIKKDSFLQE